MVSKNRAKCRICVFTGHYFPHMGGVEQYTASLWGRLAKRGYKILVVTGNTNNSVGREFVGGIEVIRLPVFSIIKGRLPIIKPAPSLFEGLRAARKWEPDLVVTNTRFFPTSVLGKFLAKLGNLPHFHIEHGSEHITLGNSILDCFGRAWDHVFGGYVFRGADRCYGVSKSIGVIACHLGCKACGVMYNGVDTGIFSPGSSLIKEKMGIDEDVFLFLFAGRLIEDKGIKVLVEAFKSLPEGSNCALAVAGSGYLENYVKEEASRHPGLHFVGRLGQNDLLDLLRSGDCFVLPTSYPEGLPTSILEAQAVGLPVITTPKGGNTEAVIDRVNGLIVPPSDAGSLRAAMEELMKDPERAKAMGKEGMNRVKENFDWDKIADRMADEIEECIGS